MNYFQLHLTHVTTHPDTLSDQLTELGAVAVTFEAADNEEIFEPDPNVITFWQHTKLIALFTDEKKLQAALMTLQLQNPSLQYQIETVAEQNWERAWMDQFQPMQFGERTWIYPSWCEPPNPNAVNILLDPGLAFGTGTHPTTALCLEWIDSHTLQNKTVIDYGCGSGILAIAALLHDAQLAYAIDYDPQALQATRDNAERNRIDLKRLSILSPENIPSDIQVDVVLANILAEPLITLAPAFANYLKPKGKLVLSGILSKQISRIKDSYQPYFSDFVVVERDGWVRISASRK